MTAPEYRWKLKSVCLDSAACLSGDVESAGRLRASRRGDGETHCGVVRKTATDSGNFFLFLSAVLALFKQMDSAIRSLLDCDHHFAGARPSVGTAMSSVSKTTSASIPRFGEFVSMCPNVQRPSGGRKQGIHPR